MTAKPVEIDLEGALSQKLLSLVRAGTEVILTEGEKPVARVVPISTKGKPRIAGLHRGAIWISDDFDQPLPDEFWPGER